jgi:Na+/H+ antiporter NhaD/arsenite permease-like protein
MMLVPVDREYLHYFDMKTLFSLFIIMLLLAGFTKIKVFEYLSTQLIHRFKSLRKLIAGLIFITFFSSMFIANDMALLTFLPLSLITLKEAHKEEHLIFTIIMQNIAANLGGMLTPFGNPENLYLYTHFHIDSIEFMLIMMKPFILSVFLISMIIFLVPNSPIEQKGMPLEKPERKQLIFLIIGSLLMIFAIFRLLNYWIVGGLILLYFLLQDRHSFGKIDYFLLLTFVCFFIFSGNFARIGVIERLVTQLLNANTYWTAVLSCQVISNVPTAVFLSQFTNNYADLLLAVNVGSVGTLVSSLASLISFRIYTKKYTNTAKKYLLSFTILNVFFLITLSTITYFIK